MVARGRSASGTIKRCSCGRVVLRIQTTKSGDSHDSTVSTTAKSSKTHARGLKAFKGLGKKNDNKVEDVLMCLDCSRKSKKGMDQKNEKLNRVRVACSLSKFTKKKESGPVTTNPPPSLIKLKSSYTTGPTSSLSDAAQFKDFFSPASTVVKKPPSRFTFEGVVPSMSSSLESLLGSMTMEEEHRDENSILNDLANTEMSAAKITKEETSGTVIMTASPHEVAALEDTNNVIPQRPRGKSSDSEISIEFSEADFLKACENGNETIPTKVIGECQDIVADVNKHMESENEADELEDPEMQAYFDCDTGESLFWVFDFNPPKDGEDQSFIDHLNAKQVWFDLNSLFGTI